MDRQILTSLPAQRRLRVLLLGSIFCLATGMLIWTLVGDGTHVAPPSSLDTAASGLNQSTDTTIFTIPDELEGVIRPIRTITTSYDHIVPVSRNLLVDTTPPDRLAATGNMDIDMWIDRLPEHDRSYDNYLIIPSLGIVVPVLQPTVARNATQSTTFDTLDKAFLSGSAIYPDTAPLGAAGNSVIGAHSSFWKTNRSHYKTIFTRLPELRAGDEVRGYVRRKNNGGETVRTWDVTVYTITDSYYMKSFDPHLFDQPREIKQVTLYTCVPIGTAKDRWIIRATEKQ